MSNRSRARRVRRMDHEVGVDEEHRLGQLVEQAAHLGPGRLDRGELALEVPPLAPRVPDAQDQRRDRDDPDDDRGDVRTRGHTERLEAHTRWRERCPSTTAGRAGIPRSGGAFRPPGVEARLGLVLADQAPRRDGSRAGTSAPHRRHGPARGRGGPSPPCRRVRGGSSRAPRPRRARRSAPRGRPSASTAAWPCARCGSCSRSASARSARAAGRRRHARSDARPSPTNPAGRCGSAGGARRASSRRRRRRSSSAARSCACLVMRAPTASWWWNVVPLPSR